MPPLEKYSGVLSSENYDMEFRSSEYDSWFTVKLLLQGDTLRVKFSGFTESEDAVFDAGNFKSEAELDEFQGRFRSLSAQLQDNQCSHVREGTLVCASASHTFGDHDLLFYDAIIEKVKHREHTFTGGEEVCSCQFLLCWQHGPNFGKLAVKSVENICIVQSNMVADPSLVAFLEIVKQKLNIQMAMIGLMCSVCSSEVPSSLREKCGLLMVRACLCWNKGTLAKADIFSNACEKSGQDIDMGGEKKYYCILVQNVEKKLSPSTISEFIHQQTSITSQVCVLPSITWESSTRAVIILDCEKDLEQLYSFLQNPNCVIISSTGKPWVVAEKRSRIDVGSLILDSSSKLVDAADRIHDDLKVVCSGTEEYKRAEEMKKLFMEFTCYQERLHKKLLIEEKTIANPF